MPQALRIAAAINTNAGAHNAESRTLARLVEPLLRETFRGNAELVIYNTDSLFDLDDAINDAVRALKANALVTVGGDGTSHQVLTRLIPACQRASLDIPAVIVAAAGTMNVIPNALGLLDGDRLSSFERTMRRLRAGTPGTVRAHALRVNGRYGFLYGAGLPVNALERYNAYKKRGMLRAAQVFGQIIADEAMTAVGAKVKRPSVAEPFGATVIGADAKGDFAVDSRRWTAMLAGTIESVGVNCRPIYRARELPGHFHLMAAEHGFWEFIRRGQAVVRGRSLGGKIDHPLTTARITYDAPMLRLFDGDMYGHNEFGPTDELGCSPPITFLTP